MTGKLYVFKTFVDGEGKFSKEDVGAGDVYVLGLDAYGNVLTAESQAQAPRWTPTTANILREQIAADPDGDTTLRIVRLVTKATKLARKAKKSLANSDDTLDAVVYIEAHDDAALVLPQQADDILDILAAAGTR